MIAEWKILCGSKWLWGRKKYWHSRRLVSVFPQRQTVPASCQRTWVYWLYQSDLLLAEGYSWALFTEPSKYVAKETSSITPNGCAFEMCLFSKPHCNRISGHTALSALKWLRRCTKWNGCVWGGDEMLSAGLFHYRPLGLSLDLCRKL